MNPDVFGKDISGCIGFCFPTGDPDFAAFSHFGPIQQFRKMPHLVDGHDVVVVVVVVVVCFLICLFVCLLAGLVVCLLVGWFGLVWFVCLLSFFFLPPKNALRRSLLGS